MQHSDVLVVSCDLVTYVQVHLLIEFHSCHQSTLTCLLSNSSPSLEEASHRKHVAAVGKLHYQLLVNETNTSYYTEHDVIAITAENQLVYFAAQADLDDSLTFSRLLLKR